MSLVINKTQLLEVINEELQKVMIDEGWAGRAYGETGPEAHEDEEDREAAALEWPGGSEEEGDLRADTRLGGDWEGAAIDDEPATKRPPQEHQDEAVRLLASYILEPTIGKLPSGAPIQLLARLLDQKGIGQQAIDILAWELYNKAAVAPTQSMTTPVGKPSLLKRMLGKAIKEDLKARMRQIVLHEVSQEQLSAIRYFTKGQPYEVESMMIQLVDRYGFDLDEVKSLAAQLHRMQSGELEQEPGAPELGQMIKEELEAYLAEKKKYKDSFYKAKEKKADELMASGTDEDDAYGIADTIVSKQGKKEKKPKKKGNKK
tara:strand:+ start:1732 stop:2682 length:951 start_codon:yes stop_codon:yes gene_type:complete